MSYLRFLRSMSTQAKNLGPSVAPVPGFPLLNLKVGRFLRVEPHPNSDRMYVSQVQLAGDCVKQICSGLREHIASESLQGKLCVVVDNMKKCKLRGVYSEAMVLCGEHTAASGQTRVELVSPEKESVDLVGRQVQIDEAHQEGTERKIKPKEWDVVSSRLQVDGSCGVVYKDGEASMPLFVKVGDEIIRMRVGTLPEGSHVR